MFLKYCLDVALTLSLNVATFQWQLTTSRVPERRRMIAFDIHLPEVSHFSINALLSIPEGRTFFCFSISIENVFQNLDTTFAFQEANYVWFTPYATPVLAYLER